jgi:nucleoside-diphosphate-sugar epimerase
MNFSTNIVLVSGANGWLGRNLVETLVNGDSNYKTIDKPQKGLIVRCLVLPGEDVSLLKSLSSQVEIVYGNLLRSNDCAAFVKNCQSATLFHTSGVIHPKRVNEFFTINVKGIKNLINESVKAKVKRIVAVSSNSPCGNNPHPDHLFDEESPYHPYMNYGRSKMEMELVIKEHYKRGNIETTIIRPPWFYGPHQPPRQTLFFQMIRDGKFPIVGQGENLRSMAYVSNICAGIILAALHEKANGETYWIADEKPYTMNEIVDTVEGLLENEFGEPCAHKRLKLPSLISEIAMWVDATLQGLDLYHQKFHVLSEMNKTIACSIEKAKKELGYIPVVALEEGMRRSIHWALSNNQKL